MEVIFTRRFHVILEEYGITEVLINFLRGNGFAALSYPAGDGGVAERLAHQVSQQRVGSQEAKPDVGGLGEVPQHW